MTGAGVQIVPWGDQALLVRLGTRIDPEVNARVMALDAAIVGAAPAWLVDCVPGYAALMIQFDPLAVSTAVVDAFVRGRLDAATSATVAVTTAARLVELPVWYAPEVGPDLISVATAVGLSVAELIQRHSAPEYRVYLLGFRPGFPFLGRVDERLSVPRLATPRLDVAAGSVGIAGGQTGIYPTRGPGGWSILGRTPRAMFQPDAAEPFALRAGDRVRFVPIDAEGFRRLGEAPRAG